MSPQSCWWRASLLCFFILAASACGDAHTRAADGEPALPSRDDPAFGTAGNVLISDGLLDFDGIRDELWIGFDRPDEWAAFLALHDRMPDSGWIGGRVVADDAHALGFYFDPATTSSAEVTAEGLQTALDGLKRAPSAAAEAPHNWYVASIVEKIVPSD
jgi:hypothetical protein